MEGKPATRVEFSVQILSCVQLFVTLQGFPGGSAGTESACNAGDRRNLGSIPGLGRSLEKGMAIHSSTLAWVAKSQTQLSNFHFPYL